MDPYVHLHRGYWAEQDVSAVYEHLVEEVQDCVLVYFDLVNATLLVLCAIVTALLNRITVCT
jgi:hypothetical protein